MAERGYRWGRFQAWGALLFAVAQFVIVHFPVSLFIGVFFLYFWTGLLRKRRYGFVLMYVTTGVAILAGLFHLAVEPTWDVFSQLVIAVCFWGIPAVFYYPKRYREFGFGKQKQNEAATVTWEKPLVSETENTVVPSRPSDDIEVQQVLDDLRKRRQQREARMRDNGQ